MYETDRGDEKGCHELIIDQLFHSVLYPVICLLLETTRNVGLVIAV